MWKKVKRKTSCRAILGYLGINNSILRAVRLHRLSRVVRVEGRSSNMREETLLSLERMSRLLEVSRYIPLYYSEFVTVFRLSWKKLSMYNLYRTLVNWWNMNVAGPLKGHFGIVKDATETTCRVEMHSSCKTMRWGAHLGTTPGWVGFR